nr:flagellar filament capping protein FliD [Pseudomonas luteola]
MALTSVTGLGSGIDIESIVTATVNAEKAPKQSQITKQQATTNATLSAIGTLKSALEAFQSSVSALNTASSFAGLNSKSSSESTLTVKSEDTAVAGKYNVSVTSLATSSRVATKGIEDASTAAFSKGVITITQGANNYPVNIDEGASLNDIKDAINTRYSSAGLSANILTDASGNTRLVLGSTKTGEGSDLTMSAVTSSTASKASDGTTLINKGLEDTFAIATGAALSIDDANSAGYVEKPAQNAEFSIDGLKMSSASNTVTSITGLSLTLAAKGDATVTVDTNTNGLKNSIQSFVMAYNTLLTATNALTKVSATTAESGTSTTASALTGDSSVRSLLNAVRSELVSPSTNGGSISLLSQLGITTQKDGTLAINDTKLSMALDSNSASITGFFTGDGGLLSRMNEAVDVYTKTGGVLSSRETSLNTKLTDLTEQQTALDRRIEKIEAGLYAKYNAMDSLISKLTSTSNSIMTTLNALNNKKDD